MRRFRIHFTTGEHEDYLDVEGEDIEQIKLEYFPRRIINLEDE